MNAPVCQGQAGFWAMTPNPHRSDPALRMHAQNQLLCLKETSLSELQIWATKSYGIFLVNPWKLEGACQLYNSVCSELGCVQREETAGAKAQKQKLCAQSYKSLKLHNRGAWGVSIFTPGLSSYVHVLFIYIFTKCWHSCLTHFSYTSMSHDVVHICKIKITHMQYIYLFLQRHFPFKEIPPS